MYFFLETPNKVLVNNTSKSTGNKIWVMTLTLLKIDRQYFSIYFSIVLTLIDFAATYIEPSYSVLLSFPEK